MTVPLDQTETARANEALAHIGEPAIVTLDDPGRAAARECRRLFAGVRDQLLRKANWQFAKASAQPPKIATPAESVWKFRYAMPTDCVAVRSIRDAENESWEVAHAGTDGDPRVMVDTDIDAATIFYTRRVTNPAQWDELFTEVFGLMLAARVNPRVGRDKGLTADLEARASVMLLQAKQKDARERAPERITRETSWTRARRGFGRREVFRG